jgi:hypothetical protein
MIIYWIDITGRTWMKATERYRYPMFPVMMVPA